MVSRDFKGIWIEKNIWLDKNLNITERVFLAEIDSLDCEERGCFASNTHFSEWSGLSKSRCTEIIKKLEEKGYITVRLIKKPNSKEIEKRILKVKKKGIRKTEYPIREIEGGYSENRTDVFEKPKERNTYIRNTERESIQEIESVKKEQKKIEPKGSTHTLNYIDLSFVDDICSIDYVKLTQIQYDNLIKKYGKKLVHDNIVKIDTYVTNNPKKDYKSYSKTINNWCKADLEKNPKLINFIEKEKKQSTTPKINKDDMRARMKADREKEWRDKALKKVK